MLAAVGTERATALPARRLGELPEAAGETGLLERVRQEVGLRVRSEDVEPLLRWSAERRAALHLAGAAQYGALLAEESAAGRRERELLTARFTTGESYFFRDAGQFDLLGATILPELIERRAAERRLRLWSAGCAAGEEPYSLAMLIEELGPRLDGWQVQIFGTDIDSAALAKARRGEYGDWSLRALDAARKARYFRRNGTAWEIAPRLREAVTFRSGDLVRDRFPDPEAGLADIDLIVCRNVFIYLDPDSVGSITAKFAEALSEGGVLLTGHGELFGHDVAPLRVRMYPQSGVLRKGPRRAPEPVPEVALPAPRAAATRAPRVERPAAKPAIPRAVPAAPNADALVEAAWRHADRGRREEAERECRRAIAVAAFDPRPYYILAQLAQERGDFEQARELLRKVIYLDGSFVAAYLELAALNEQAGDEARARRRYEAACRALERLPAGSRVPPYAGLTAGEILASVQRLLRKG